MKKKDANLDLTDLAASLVSDINVKFKTSNDKVAFLMDGEELTPADVTEWVSSGSSMLDIGIANRPYGGYPVGRITELTGLEQSGKSLAVLHALKSTQMKGGLAVLIDTENAFSREFAEAIGLDLKKLLYIQLEAIEDVFTTIELIIEKVRKADDSKLITIAVDSVMGASTKEELASEYENTGFATSKAKFLSKSMRMITNYIGKMRICLIFTNQLRVKLNTMAFADPYTTSGGKALSFHSSVRVRLQSAGQIKIGTEVIGMNVKCKIIKNRLGPPLRNVEYNIYFDSGIDDYGSWLEVMKSKKLVSAAGAWYTYNVVDKETGEVLKSIKFQSKDFYSKLIVEENLRETIYQEICDSLILKYKINGEGGEEAIGIDDIEIDENNMILEND